MMHPEVIRPAEHALYAPEKMGKSTLFQSPRLLVGLNAFEPGQSHALHAHAGMDKVYSVVEGSGVFLLADRELRSSLRHPDDHSILSAAIGSVRDARRAGQ
jgi:gentisate 1,2-dioxygenase